MSKFELNKTMFLEPRTIPVSAWLGHIPLAGWIVEAAQPRILVELGTHLGASYFAFCQAVQESGLDTRCYAVDTWQGDEHAGQYDEEVFRSVADHHRDHYEGFSKLMRMTFDQARSYFDDGSIDLLHIDGLHTYDAVRQDFETWLPKMSRRGVVLFHDTNVRERDFGVWKLWAELRDLYPSFEFSHTHGLGVLLVGSDAPEPLQMFIHDACAAKSGEVSRLFERLGLLITTRQRLHVLAGHQVNLECDNGHVRKMLAECEHLLKQRDSSIGELQALVHEHQSRAADLEVELAESGTRFDQREVAFGENCRALAECESTLADCRRVLAERESELAESRYQLSERTATLAAVTAGAKEEVLRREGLQAESVASSERLASVEAEKVSLNSRVVCLENELLEAAGSLAACQDEAKRLRRDLTETHGKLSEIIGSTTWRLTAPVRNIVSLLRGSRSRTSDPANRI